MRLTLAELLILLALQGSKAVINIDEALSADGGSQRRWQYCFAQGIKGFVGNIYLLNGRVAVPGHGAKEIKHHPGVSCALKIL